MNRRSIMAMFGLGPVAASFAPSPVIRSGVYDVPAHSVAGTIASSPTPNHFLKMAHKSGLLSEAVLRKALARERGWSSAPGQETIEGYKSMSAVAKRRLIEKAREDDAWRKFIDGEPPGLWDLARKAEEMFNK